MRRDDVGAVEPDYSTRGLNPERLAAIERFSGREVLDVGCGSGAYVLHLADRLQIRGMDYREFDSWKPRRALFEVSDAQQLNVSDSSVDTILSFETLEHLPDPERALKEYLRVCRKNLILTVPNCQLTMGMRRSGLIYNHWIDRTHVNFWDMDGICDLISKMGFEVSHRQHINQVSPGGLVFESLGLGGTVARIGAGLLRRLQRQRYWMTSLVVANKPAQK
jgi:SAM-dependent methyltransferase